MKVVQLNNRRVHWITPYEKREDAPPFASNIILVEAPDDVREGWLYDAETGEFSEPETPDVSPEKPATLEELKEYALLNMQLTLEAIEAMEGGE